MVPWWRANRRDAAGGEKIWTVHCWLCKNFPTQQEKARLGKLAKDGLALGGAQIQRLSEHVKHSNDKGTDKDETNAQSKAKNERKHALTLYKYKRKCQQWKANRWEDTSAKTYLVSPLEIAVDKM